jgi:hypothetical protein
MFASDLTDAPLGIDSMPNLYAILDEQMDDTGERIDINIRSIARKVRMDLRQESLAWVAMTVPGRDLTPEQDASTRLDIVSGEDTYLVREASNGRPMQVDLDTWGLTGGEIAQACAHAIGGLRTWSTSRDGWESHTVILTGDDIRIRVDRTSITWIVEQV